MPSGETFNSPFFIAFLLFLSSVSTVLANAVQKQIEPVYNGVQERGLAAKNESNKETYYEVPHPTLNQQLVKLTVGDPPSPPQPQPQPQLPPEPPLQQPEPQPQPPPPPVPQPQQPSRKAQLTAMGREFLRPHNQLRKYLNQTLYSWDSKLARYARRFAAQRRTDCTIKHSSGPYGENVFWGSGWDWRPSDAVRKWVKEHNYYNATDNSCLPNKMCGHYTQIVWRESMRLGCALQLCKGGGVFIVCNYDPPGNYVGESPFQ